MTGAASAEPVDPVPIDCEAPAPDVEPGTNEWRERDAVNMYCALQRHGDQAQHPATVTPVPGPSTTGERTTNDGYRQPSRHKDVRFRFQTTTIAGLSAEVYRPCPTDTSVCPNMPQGLQRSDGPYPAVIVIHGLTARKELQWWASQPLVEAGYFVVAFQSAGVGPTVAEATAVLNWLKAPGNPFAAEIDTDHIGVTGHSQGGGVSTTLGQQNPGISAIVAWDDYTGSMGQNPKTPELFILADYLTWPGYPQPYSSPPNRETHRGDPGSAALKSRGIDTMRLAFRASTHLDWVGTELSGNRYAELLTVYYTIAWFDRYLKGDSDPLMAQDAFDRLTATAFDASADRHNISQGLWDPAKAVASGDPVYGGNVPYRLNGKATADRLSFYFLSKCFLSVPGTSARAESNDVRAEGCSAA